MNNGFVVALSRSSYLCAALYVPRRHWRVAVVVLQLVGEFMLAVGGTGVVRRFVMVGTKHAIRLFC